VGVLQNTATRCNMLQHTATHYVVRRRCLFKCRAVGVCVCAVCVGGVHGAAGLSDVQMYIHTLQHTATHYTCRYVVKIQGGKEVCVARQVCQVCGCMYTRCNTLQHTTHLGVYGVKIQAGKHAYVILPFDVILSKRAL